MKIGGNIMGVIQIKTVTGKNSIGESTVDWVDVLSVKGFLDLNQADVHRETYQAKIKESSHVFICDYQNLKGISADWLWDPLKFDLTPIKHGTGEAVDITSELCRMVINGTVYQINYIDDPMELHKHLEIFLNRVGV